MPSGELDKKQYAHTCDACGQIFDLSITFCPHDGTRLTKELVGATSHDLIKITGPGQSIKPGTDSGNNPKASTAGQPYVSSKKDLESTDPGYGGSAELDGRTLVNADSPARSRSGPPPPEPHQKENLLGTVLDDKYEIIELIGRGGMSLVYKAKHLVLKTHVAIKTLLPHLVLHPMSLQRFHQEAQAASNLRHPNVITVYDFGTTPDGQPYLVMDYVEGFSLGDVLEKEHHLKPERALNIFIQVADALSHAHSKGIIHRDLKPTNILLLEKDGKADFVNIVDFGIAKLLPQEGADAVSLTQTGEVFGSPLYMSPEQCKGEKLDARADIYSMGCLMYETLTGRTPIDGDNTMEVLFKHIHEVPPSMSDSKARVADRLERIVFKCLAKDPAQRYQSMGQLKEELETYQSQTRSNLFGSITSRWELFWLKRRPRTLREKVTVSLAVLGIGTAIALGGYLGMSYWNAANSQAARTDLIWDEDRTPPAPLESSAPNAALNATWHCESLQRMIDSHDPPEDILNYMREGVTSLEEQKDYRQAVRLLRLSARYAIKSSGGLNKFPAMRMQIQYADCARKAQYYEEAAGAYTVALKIMSPFDHPDRSHVAGSLGDVYYLQGKWKEAAAAYTYALEESTKDPGNHFVSRGSEDEVSKERDTMIHLYSSPATPQEAKESSELTMIVSRLATAFQHLLDGARSDKKQELVERYQYVTPKEFLDAYERWKLIRGPVNNNEAVALANYLETEHMANKDQKLDRLYDELLTQIPDLFGKDSTYNGVVLLRHSEYLWDLGDYAGAIRDRFKALNIFSKAK